MKKTLLISAALMAAGSAFAAAPAFDSVRKADFLEGPKAPATTLKATTRAEGAMESFDFTYADAPYTALSLNGTTGATSRVFMAFQMSAEDIKTFAGSKVTGFSVYSPTNYEGTSNSVTEARFFYSTDPELSKEEYTQDFTMTKTAFGLNEVSMTEPYTITGEEEALYFGYSLVVPKKNDMYYVVVDYIANDATTGIVGVSADGTGFPEQFQVFGNSYGALCMSVRLERESLPKFADITSFPASVALPLGQSVAYPISLKATSGSPIESVTLEYSIAGEEFVKDMVFATPLPAGASRMFSANLEFPAFDKKFSENVKFTLTKINGLDNPGENASVEAMVGVVDELPARQTLIEEYTGTWCPWCTRGYAALEYISHNYPEFVTAAYHNDDPMEITQDYPADISGFPSASLNRGIIVDPYEGTGIYDLPVPIIGDINALNEAPTAWSVEANHEWESDNVLVAKAKVVNVAGCRTRGFKIAYLLVADGLTGKTSDWFQANNYSTQSPKYVEELNAFCRGGEYGKSKVAGLVFNDVVISSSGIYGISGSIPASLEAGEVVEHSLSYDLSKIPSDLIADKNKLRIVAAVVDANGNVLNCAKNEVNDLESNAVSGIADENAPVEYFNLNGQKIAQPTQGVFIRRQGGNAEKVMVK